MDDDVILEGEPTTAWDWLKRLSQACGGFNSHERTGKASNAELKRWIERKAVLINMKAVKVNDMIEGPITSCVIFPSSAKSKTTFR